MTALSTPVHIPKPDFSISYHSGVLFMGSCFADNIGSKMKALKYRVCHNPFGVVYNPLSLAKQIELLLQKEKFTKNDLHFRDNLWFSFMHYTLFSDPDPESCLEKINKAFHEAKQLLVKAEVVVLTLGTSFVYEWNETGEIVSNCHKIPAAEFTNRFAEPQEIIARLKSVIEAVRKVNPNVQIVFTVSPIRHFKHGAINNQRSKAGLILAVGELQNSLDRIFYFPAYEIFMDELRDYRFYASDMLHPSETGIEYIWQRFGDTFFDAGTVKLQNEIEKLLKAVNHKPRHTAGKAHKEFLKSLRFKIQHAQDKHPQLNFQSELAEIEKTFNILK